ncbi:hypothetical protein O3P16_07695 [Chitinophagaceae bacterium LY-5]|uniref:Uncharacterized protein n=1 Tax=Polluticaenibacter yanchengensis TaxID=3014562 RepID=A0ABT4UIQ2_9BACT|nr:hypothetical protein [Chitinophagaceae bacterium LY-5]
MPIIHKPVYAECDNCESCIELDQDNPDDTLQQHNWYKGLTNVRHEAVLCPSCFVVHQCDRTGFPWVEEIKH